MARIEIDTRAFVASHWREPRPAQDGLWLFTNAATGETVERNGRFSQVRRALPAGTWKVLP